MLVALAAFLQVSRQPISPPVASKIFRHQNAPAKIRTRHDDGTATSGNWSGYAVTAANGSVTDVSGSWTVPPVNCTSGPATGYAAFWVGIDGYSSSTVEQTGTDSDCSSGTPTYYAWYEFYPHASILIGGLTISPGDVISAEVKSTGSGNFTVTLTDTSTGKTFSTSGKVSGAEESSAEWIAEAPSSSSSILPLADFGSVSFASCMATVGGTSGSIGSFTNDAITMVSSGGTDEAVPTALSGGTSFVVNYVPPPAPVLSITKTHSGSFTQGQTNAAYTITVSNQAGAAATNGTATVTETPPSGLTLASMSGSGWSCSGTTCSRTDSLAAGLSYPAITALVNVAANASSPQVNQVSVSGAGSATASAMDSTTIVPANPAVLSITKTHDGNFTQGQTNAAYTITVSNQAGAGATNGTATVTETPPSGLTLASMSGSGWSCSGTTCSRTDSLAAGLSYPAITALVNVAANASSPQVNQVSVSGAGSATASAMDSATIVPANPPVLSITKTHSGSFTQGQTNAAYTITVSNQAGAAATNGTATVTETPPSGLTLASMSGSGWSCSGTTCSRTDSLAAGLSYPAITALVNVAANASSPQVNQVSVSGAGSATASAMDSATILPANPPVLSITKTHSGSFTQGQTNAAYTITVSNQAGAAATNGTATVTETPPSGLTLASMSGSGWSCSGTTCSRTDSLAAGLSYPAITALVNVAANASSPQVNQVSVSGAGSATASAMDSTTIVPANPAVLSITKTHDGNFTQGQTNAAYTITVSNQAGAGATNGTATVTETPPSGLTLASMSGSGWSCSGTTCSRTDSLAAGLSYPAITAL